MKKIHKLTINSALLIAIIGILLILVGTSYAVFSTAITSQKTQIIKVGILKLELTEPIEGLNLGQIASSTDAEGLIVENYYDFSLTNVGDAHAAYKILLIDDENAISSYEGELLNIDYIKFGLEVKGTETGPFNLGITQRVLNEGIVKTAETIDFRLRIWLNFTGLSIQEKEALNGQQVFFKIKIEAEQHLGEVEEGIDFVYNGKVQEFTAQKSGYYKVELWGAQGGSAKGGLGGHTNGTIYLEKNDTIYLYIGGQPASNSGGWNGGGRDSNDHMNIERAFGGGGATDVRLTKASATETVWNEITSLRSRIMVAAGGAGASKHSPGVSPGSGGGLQGKSGWSGGSQYTGSGGTQISAGDTGPTGNGLGGFGYGGTYAYGSAQDYASGGGGSGWYGGGAGGAVASYQITSDGGGGSSYIAGYAGVNSITSASSSTHTDNTDHYSGKYFIKSNTQTGTNTGNGKAKITYVSNSMPKTNPKLNNVRYIKNCINGNSVNVSNHWVELQAIKDGVNIARGKTVTSSVTPSSGSLALVINANIVSTEYLSLTSGLQCVTVDLGVTYDLDEVALWLYYADGRRYNDNTLSVGATNVSGTGALETILHSYPGTTGYNETMEGKRYTAWDTIDPNEVVNYYKTGTEYLGVSGGWSVGYTSIGTNTFVKNSGNITITSSGYERNTAVTNNTVFLNKISTIKVKVTRTGGSTGHLFVATTRTADNGYVTNYTKYANIPIGSNQTISLDVSNLTGGYYIGVGGQGAIVTITEVWGEK